MQEMPESVGDVSMAVDPDAVCSEEACCICFESPLREPTRTKCNHWFCWSVPIAGIAHVVLHILHFTKQHSLQRSLVLHAWL